MMDFYGSCHLAVHCFSHPQNVARKDPVILTMKIEVEKLHVFEMQKKHKITTKQAKCTKRWFSCTFMAAGQEILTTAEPTWGATSKRNRMQNLNKQDV